MSVTNIKDPSSDIVYDTNVALNDEKKDYLLEHLTLSDLETFKYEIEAELQMRKSVMDRYSKYRYQLNYLREEFSKKRQEELDKLEKELENSKTKIRKHRLEDDEDEDDEEEEEPIKKPKKKYNRKKT